MSREVRRVPVSWQHPTVPNPYWLEQTASRLSSKHNLSLLHMPQVRFVGLVDGYTDAHTTWCAELADLEARRGSDWSFHVEYHLTGFKGREDDEETVHPFSVWAADGQTSHAVTVRDEDHLHDLVLNEKRHEEPDPDDYMPTFDAADDLGWCLYETVSEGTPVTPVFATAEDLIEHLATVGQDWEQQPMRRAAAELLVRRGSSMGSMAVVDGTLYRSDVDADRLANALSQPGRS